MSAMLMDPCYALALVFSGDFALLEVWRNPVEPQGIHAELTYIVDIMELLRWCQKKADHLGLSIGPGSYLT